MTFHCIIFFSKKLAVELYKIRIYFCYKSVFNKNSTRLFNFPCIFRFDLSRIDFKSSSRTANFFHFRLNFCSKSHLERAQSHLTLAATHCVWIFAPKVILRAGAQGPVGRQKSTTFCLFTF